VWRVRRARAALGVLVLLAVPMTGVLISVLLIGLGVLLLELTESGGANSPAQGFVLIVWLGVITLLARRAGAGVAELPGPVQELTDATGAMPPDLAAGFGAYLAEPSVQRFIAAIADRPDDEVRPLDSHPATARRLAVLRDPACRRHPA